MDRSDWGDDDAEGFRPPLPPEDRVWRHPSELGAGFLAAPPAPSGSRSKGPLVVAVVAAGLLLVVATGASVRFMTSSATSAASSPTLASLVRTSATIVPTSALTAGVDVAARLANGTERTSRAVVVDEATVVTTIAAITGSASIAVVLPGNRRLEAHVLGRDRDAGIAVLDVTGGALESDQLGSVVAMHRGDDVWLSGQKEPGTISALGRHTTMSDGAKIHHVLRLDVDVQRADEGQPLLDRKGAVIGLCAWDAKGDVVGIPADLLTSAAHSLRTYDRLALPWIGVSGRDADEDAAKGWPDGGAMLTEITGGSPAEQAGLQAGDVVVSLGSRPVSSISGLVLAARAYDIGEAVTIGLLRDGSPMTVALTLGELAPR